MHYGSGEKEQRYKVMEKEYKFNGWKNVSGVRAVDTAYTGVDTPLDLYDRLSDVWCVETCAPRLRSVWSEKNKTCGQCSITAFLVQDIFGGEVYGLLTEQGDMHCYNKVGDIVFDLASEQFGRKAASLVYDCSLLQDRESEIHFADKDKRERYELLKSKLLAECSMK